VQTFLRMSERPAKSRRDEVQRWYEQYGPVLVAYASSILGERSRAEDALQEVFYKLLKGKMEVTAPEKAYLLRAVRNTALSMARRSGREVVLDGEATEHGERTARIGDGWFEAPAELSYWSSKLESAVRELPTEQSEVLVMRIWGEMKFDEIASVLEISINTVASRYRYALATLRERMQPFEARNEHAAK
jgi:RNA polymerase sigma factor (sigma-70 family)